MPPLQPPTIEAIRFRAARHVLDVAGIDEGDCKAASRKNLQQRHPRHARGFHDDCRDPTGGQPIGQPMQVTGKADIEQVYIAEKRFILL